MGKQVKRLNNRKASGYDLIPSRFLKIVAKSFTSSFKQVTIVLKENISIWNEREWGITINCLRDKHFSIYRMNICWVVAIVAQCFILLMFDMIPNVSEVRAWRHGLQVLFDKTTQLWALGEMATKIRQLSFSLCPLPKPIVNSVNSQIRLQCTIKLNNMFISWI